MKRRVVPGEVIADLRLRLARLKARSPERVALVKNTADLFGVSVSSVYRALTEKTGPRRIHRADQGRSRKLNSAELHQFCEVIAALKCIRNKKGRHMGTAFAIHLLETTGVDTPSGRVKAPPWIDLSRGRPKLMLFSVTDDRSGVCYQDYDVVFGENECSAADVTPTQIVDEVGIDILGEKLITPLQINQHLAMSLEAGRSADERPVSASINQSIISPSVSDWESTQARLGYDDRSIAGLLDTKTREVRALFSGKLEASRSSQLLSQLKQAVGISTKYEVRELVD